jgi:hypothetical protein
MELNAGTRRLMIQSAIRSQLSVLDPQAELLAESARVAWWRTAWGVIGVAELDDEQSITTLPDITRTAYALLDFLPEAKLPMDDLWNLTLVLAVPWTFQDATQHDRAWEALEAATRDTTGARKVILWSDERLADHFGRLTTAAQVQSSVLDDPLRDAIAEVSRDADERTALDALFKRRLSEDDVDDLVCVLGREKRP